MAVDRRLLADLVLGTGLHPEDVRVLSEDLNYIRFKAGMYPLRRERRVPAAGLLLRGSAVMRHAAGEGELLSPIRPGEWFGCEALLDGGLASVDVLAESDLEVGLLSQDLYRQYMQRDNGLGMRVQRSFLCSLAGQLMRMDDDLLTIRKAFPAG